MLYQVSVFPILVILTKHCLVPVEQLRQTTRQFLGDPILAGFLEHSFHRVQNLRCCGGTSFKPWLSLSIIGYVMFIDTGEGFHGEPCCQFQRLVGRVDTTYDDIPLSTWPVNDVGKHHLVTQAFIQSFWSMVV